MACCRSDLVRGGAGIGKHRHKSLFGERLENDIAADAELAVGVAADLRDADLEVELGRLVDAHPVDDPGGIARACVATCRTLSACSGDSALPEIRIYWSTDVACTVWPGGRCGRSLLEHRRVAGHAHVRGHQHVVVFVQRQQLQPAAASCGRDFGTVPSPPACGSLERLAQRSGFGDSFRINRPS
jgi:hypothetical protein